MCACQFYNWLLILLKHSPDTSFKTCELLKTRKGEAIKISFKLFTNSGTGTKQPVIK